MQLTQPESEREIERLAEALRAVPVGATASYAELCSAAGRDVQAEARVNLMKARRAVEEEDGTRFATVFKRGVRRLPAEELPNIGRLARRKIRSVSSQAVKRLTGISANDVGPDVERRIIAERSHLGAIGLAAREGVQRKFDEAVRTVGPDAGAARTLVDALLAAGKKTKGGAEAA